MCGIIGLILGHWEDQSDQNVAAIDLHEALYYLQHRGQDAAGIATCSTGGRMYVKTDFHTFFAQQIAHQVVDEQIPVQGKWHGRCRLQERRAHLTFARLHGRR